MESFHHYYVSVVERIPVLRRLRRKYSNYKMILVLGLACLLAGSWLGVWVGGNAASQAAGPAPSGSLSDRTRMWMRRSFAPTIPVAGHQKDGTFVLANFETVNDFKLWTVGGAMIETSTDHPSEGDYGARVTFYGKEKLSGVSIEEYFTSRFGLSDWTPYAAFRFYAYNPNSDTLRMIVQVKDRWGTPYKQEVTLGPGEGRYIEMPTLQMAAVIKLQNIEQLTFFVWEAAGERKVYLDHLYLVPKEA
ncbi:MAG TPA: hypothetical protein VL688_10350 [Verrucomicrobiae bacterium]|nr:hypothetical protein [Verrucomicrobiae bacterium]